MPTDDDDAGIDEETWDELVQAIKESRCTPFLGAGVNVPRLPTGAALAQRLANAWGYPLDDSSDLMRVCEYRAVMRDASYRPKRDVADLLRTLIAQAPPPDELAGHHQVEANYRILARLRAPIYITTNYDDLMVSALRADGQKAGIDHCRWHNALGPAEGLSHDPIPGAPLVYHLHGQWDLPPSMVLTESDYVTFLSRLTDELEIIPARIRAALSDSVLLFVGYGLSDWNFRVIHRVLMRRDETGGNPGVAVQLRPLHDPDRQARVREYLRRYFQKWKLKVFWGTATDFMGELSKRI